MESICFELTVNNDPNKGVLTYKGQVFSPPSPSTSWYLPLRISDVTCDCPDLTHNFVSVLTRICEYFVLLECPCNAEVPYLATGPDSKMVEPIFDYQFRLILIGDSTVGKSSLLKYFTDGKFAEV